jgi:hypothetical protein
MFSLTKRFGVVAVLTLASAAYTVPNVHGQPIIQGGYSPFFRIRPGLTIQQHAYNLNTVYGVRSQYAPYVLGYNPYRAPVVYSQPSLGNSNPYLYSNPYSPYVSPSGAASLYNNPYSNSPGYGDAYSNSMYSNPYYPYSDPIGSYLQGAASVVNAQGQFMVKNQQALLMREQVLQDRVRTQRAIFDEYLYERERRPTPEDELDRYRKERHRHSLNNADVTEIWSGKALNDLLANLRKNPPRGDVSSLRTFDLDPDTVKQINVKPSGGTGNIGLLKNGGQLSWPSALNNDEFKDQRDKIDTLVGDAVKQARFNNKVESSQLQDLQKEVDRMQRQLRKNNDLGINQYIESKTFLSNLSDAITALGQRNVGDYFGTGKYVLSGKSATDVVKYMLDNGLSFAPAVPGSEASYVALYNALAGYDQAVNGRVAERERDR